MITLDSIQQTHAFFHQKYRVYAYSSDERQRDDIEWAIGSYVAQMNQELYALLAAGRDDFLLAHARFAADMEEALQRLEERPATADKLLEK